MRFRKRRSGNSDGKRLHREPRRLVLCCSGAATDQELVTSLKLLHGVQLLPLHFSYTPHEGSILLRVLCVDKPVGKSVVLCSSAGDRNSLPRKNILAGLKLTSVFSV